MADVTFYSQAGADAKFALKAALEALDTRVTNLPTGGGSAGVLVLDSTAEVPAGTPVDTVIVRRA